MKHLLFVFVFIATARNVRMLNVALHKPAYQSSTHYFYKCGFLNASKAVDGNRNPDTFSCSCAHVADVYGDPVWLSVDLQAKYLLDFVMVYNRAGDWLLSGRLSYFWVGLTNVDVTVKAPQRGQYPLCGQYPGNMSFLVVGKVKCNYNLPSGRFIVVQMDLNAGDGKALSVCELEAYAVNQSNPEYIWRSRRQARLMGFVASTWSIKLKLIRCIVKCISNNPKCDSINRNVITNTCEFNIHRNGFNSSSVKNSTNWGFWLGTFA